MNPITRIFPRNFDNNYVGRKLALWLFIPVVLMKLGMSLGSIFRGYSVAQSADGIPLDTFATAEAQAVVSLIALLGLLHLLLGALGVLALIRYRTMIPLLYGLFLVEHLGRKVIFLVKPIVRSGTPPGTYVNLALLVLMSMGLVLSLWRPTMRSNELPPGGAGGSRSP